MPISIPGRSFKVLKQTGVAFFGWLAYPDRVMKLFSVLLSVIGFGLCSCERHEWESETPKSSDTINLFKHEEDHGSADKHPEKDGEETKHEAKEPAGE